MTQNAAEATATAGGPDKMDQEPSFPSIPQDQYGVFELDKKNGALWIGVRINSMDYTGACAFLDSMKFNVWQVYKDIIAQMRQREQLTRGASPQGGLAGLAKKLGLKG